MQELRTVQIDDDEMEISDDDYEKRPKRTRYDSDGLKVSSDQYTFFKYSL